MQSSGMPWPGDEGQQRWEQAWMAIKKVDQYVPYQHMYTDKQMQPSLNKFMTRTSLFCQVWASKWNERAYFSTRKVKLDHDYLCMAVLVQEIINADYAFVIHTTNPSSGDSSEIYAEVIYIYIYLYRFIHFNSKFMLIYFQRMIYVLPQVVKGLGETLVGAYPGRALSFICKKNALNSPQVCSVKNDTDTIYG